jgi:hypothetical protein
LKKNRILKDSDINALFSNLTMLLGVNSELLGELEKDDAEDNIGQTFCFMVYLNDVFFFTRKMLT